MFWNWSHFFLHQIWLLAILEFQPREDRKQSLDRRSITESALVLPVRMVMVEDGGGGGDRLEVQAGPQSYLVWSGDQSLCSMSGPLTLACSLLLLITSLTSSLKCFADVEGREMSLCEEKRGYRTCFIKYNQSKSGPFLSFIFLCKSWNIVMKWRTLSLWGKVQQKINVENPS